MALSISIPIVSVTAKTKLELQTKIVEMKGQLMTDPELIRVLDDIHGYFEYWFSVVRLQPKSK